MPYKSKAQAAYFHAAEARGDIAAKTVAEYDRASKGRRLPERVSSDEGGKDDIMKAGRLAIMVLGKGPGPGGSGDDGDHGPSNDDESGDDVGLEDLGKEAIDAVHSKDAQGFADAVRAIVRMCNEEGYGDDNEGE